VPSVGEKERANQLTPVDLESRPQIADVAIGSC